MKEAREEITLKMAGQRGREMRHFSCKNEWKGALAFSSIFLIGFQMGSFKKGHACSAKREKWRGLLLFVSFASCKYGLVNERQSVPLKENERQSVWN